MADPALIETKTSCVHALSGHATIPPPPSSAACCCAMSQPTSMPSIVQPAGSCQLQSPESGHGCIPKNPLGSLLSVGWFSAYAYGRWLTPDPAGFAAANPNDPQSCLDCIRRSCGRQTGPDALPRTSRQSEC